MAINILKERIEVMEKYHQIEILRILRRFPEVKTNENNNGTFKDLEKYTDYVDEQQKLLKKVEKEKEQLEQAFF